MLLRGEDGRVDADRVIATVVLRQLDGERWFVTAATSPEVEVAAPAVLEAIASPVRFSGRGEGYESNVVLRVHRRFDPEPLAMTHATFAGSTEIAPFDTTLAFDAHAGGVPAVIVARTGGGIHTGGAYTAFPVRPR